MTERIRALVVDDEPAARAAIHALLADDPAISQRRVGVSVGCIV